MLRDYKREMPSAGNTGHSENYSFRPKKERLTRET